MLDSLHDERLPTRCHRVSSKQRAWGGGKHQQHLIFASSLPKNPERTKRQAIFFYPPLRPKNTTPTNQPGLALQHASPSSRGQTCFVRKFPAPVPTLWVRVVVRLPFFRVAYKRRSQRGKAITVGVHTPWSSLFGELVPLFRLFFLRCFF